MTGSCPEHLPERLTARDAPGAQTEATRLGGEGLLFSGSKVFYKWGGRIK